MKKWICATGLVWLLLACQTTSESDKQPPVIKGAWVTNVASDVLLSREGIEEAVKLAKSAGLTHLCVVTWNNGRTMYRSSVMQRYFGEPIDTVYGDRDPLKEIIEVAHREGLKVIAWFEFGFSSHYGPQEDHVLQRYPHWASKGADGKVVVENGFTWMNSFLPEVQRFLSDLILEVVEQYDVDGIQGDDRLPAAPVRAGYDDYTVDLYKKAHGGALPPQDHTDSAWIDWRARLMNDYALELYREVKKLKPHVLVAHAPSIYPWSKEHYLQDWPAWLAEGSTDIVMPQVYRYKLEAYQNTLDDMVRQVGPDRLHRVFPGVLTSLGDGYLIPDSLLQQCIEYNRSKGIHGEVFFYFEGIRRSPAFYTETYPKLR